MFEHCNSSLTKSLIKPLLKYLLPGQKAVATSRKNSGDSASGKLKASPDGKNSSNRKMSEISGLESVEDDQGASVPKYQSRSNH